MPAPSLCGDFLTNKRSLIAFTWTLTTVLTLAAFIVALAMTIHNNYYNADDGNPDNNEQNRGGGAGHSADREYEQFLQLSRMGSASMTFVALYTAAMAVALTMYGSTAIVGFTSLRGVYIAPCFSYPSASRFKVGIFGGAIIFFANLLLVCAVVFGEVRVRLVASNVLSYRPTLRNLTHTLTLSLPLVHPVPLFVFGCFSQVEDWRENNRDQENGNNDNEREPYEIERIATILAVTCMFLSALYTIFAVLLFLYYGSSDDPRELDDDVDGVVIVPGAKQPTSLQLHRPLHHHHNIAVGDPRRENFLTLGGGT